MSNLAQPLQPERVAAPSMKALYDALSPDAPAADAVAQARVFLEQQLQEARRLPSDLPSDMHGLAAWIDAHTDAVGQQYRAYLAERKAGAPRRFFTSKSHALYFIKSAAPTKLVDGSWLYGTLQHWQDDDFKPLINIYLEELGSGVPEKNHVVLYRKLLATHGCEDWATLPDPLFQQGAIQLALAHDAQHFLPELIGFNLGYEQLPLHLLITAYELNELGIDPYYFTLHITVDNAATGHAQSAMQGVLQAAPRVGDDQAFFRRVVDGYRLNDLGVGTNAIIASFDLEAELVALLAAKSVVGKNMHSDYCRIAGRTVNEWLTDPAQISAFLLALEKAGWIKRGEDPEQSRFWQLIHGEKAEMFGVFNDYEQQILHDWILTPRAAGDEVEPVQVPDLPPMRTYRQQQRLLHAGTPADARPARPHTQRPLLRSHRDDSNVNMDGQGFRDDLRLLEDRIASLGSKQQAMAELIRLMSPGNHHTAAGLMATRIFQQMLG